LGLEERQNMSQVKIAIIGLGNCASSLIQGLYYYRNKTAEEAIGILHWDIGGYKPWDIKVVAAFDINKRKINQDVNAAIFEKPNCTTIFCPDIPSAGVSVHMGKILDGFSDHMKYYPEDETFVVSNEKEPTKEEVVQILKDSKTDILVNYLPVGSEKATHFYVECALEAGVALVNNIPVIIASDPIWANRFKEKNLPLIGDDIKSQLGATITHRVLSDIFKKRGVKIDRTYQLNTGGNTDFLNMLNRDRLISKKISKTEAVQSAMETRLSDDNVHIGPSDYVPWQKDNKICFIRIEGRLFGDVPMNLEMRLSVEDSPNSAGVAIDTIRCAKLALDRKQVGILEAPSAYFCKHPPVQFPDDKAYSMMEEFIKGGTEQLREMSHNSRWKGKQATVKV